MLSNQTQRQVNASRSMTYRLGRFEFHPNEWLLTLEGVAVPIGIRAIEILLALIERPGEIISRDELTKSVWRGQFIHEGNLRSQMCVLRRVLAAGFNGVAPIKTVPLRGYVFVGHVMRMDNERPVMATLPPGRDSVARRDNLALPLTRGFDWDEGLKQICLVSPKGCRPTTNTSGHIVEEMATLVESLLGRFQSLEIIVATREL